MKLSPSPAFILQARMDAPDASARLSLTTRALAPAAPGGEMDIQFACATPWGIEFATVSARSASQFIDWLRHAVHSAQDLLSGEFIINHRAGTKFTRSVIVNPATQRGEQVFVFQAGSSAPALVVSNHEASELCQFLTSHHRPAA